MGTKEQSIWKEVGVLKSEIYDYFSQGKGGSAAHREAGGVGHKLHCVPSFALSRLCNTPIWTVISLKLNAEIPMEEDPSILFIILSQQL